ncbi:hypothetical protein E3C22_06650 [Jiella endophytica]|uniref:Uncharacterized protein n=1 Tax=Jiella endophytica TaxID=2558362 RepID=A0A4Y8RNY8_9HYPH|nr:hypothetical protein [Jiella endophytica]TFF25056.1 hypothetical protein E3C22_06650 [Jiella endophytica]
MADQSFETILDGVVARHQDKSWRSVLSRASGGVMSAVGLRRGPKIAESVAGSAAARAAYDEGLDLKDEDEDDFSDFDAPSGQAADVPQPKAARTAERPRQPEPPRPRDVPKSQARPDTRRSPDPSGTAQSGRSASGSANEVRAAYAKAGDEAPPPPTPGAPSIDPLDVQRDLNILTATSVKDLLDARRNFARANHPDRMPILYRPQATIRMQIANRLVDDAIARMSGQGRR